MIDRVELKQLAEERVGESHLAGSMLARGVLELLAENEALKAALVEACDIAQEAPLRHRTRIDELRKVAT